MAAAATPKPVAPAPSGASIEVMRGFYEGLELAIDSDWFVIGRGRGADAILAEATISRAHAAVGFDAATGFFVQDLGSFYAVAALFGFIYAGVMPLYSVLARENFPQRMMGTVIGGTAMAGSLGMATGPLAGGLIYDTFASYTWLYVGAWGIGIGAFLIAITFRPFPKIEPAPARA